MGIAIDAAEEYSPRPPQRSVRPMTARLLALADARQHPNTQP